MSCFCYSLLSSLDVLVCRVQTSYIVPHEKISPIQFSIKGQVHRYPYQKTLVLVLIQNALNNIESSNFKWNFSRQVVITRPGFWAKVKVTLTTYIDCHVIYECFSSFIKHLLKSCKAGSTFSPWTCKMYV